MNSTPNANTLKQFLNNLPHDISNIIINECYIYSHKLKFTDVMTEMDNIHHNFSNDQHNIIRVYKNTIKPIYHGTTYLNDNSYNCTYTDLSDNTLILEVEESGNYKLRRERKQRCTGITSATTFLGHISVLDNKGNTIFNIIKNFVKAF